MEETDTFVDFGPSDAEPGAGATGGSSAEPDDPERTGEDESAALARLRETLIASDPLVAPELVRAGSIAELEQSFAAAKAAAGRARDLTLAAAAPRISSGAPGRATLAPASAFEKIRAGLQRRS